VWVTIASVNLTEATGEFTNDHVFRRVAGGGTWEPRVGGLLPSNPVNAILIDPSNPDRLFIGCDLGAFKTELAGTSWEVWDHGLPNVPIFDLQLQPSRRLVRAATHGRGIWERPIDTAMCNPVDVYVRDNIVDSGRVIPCPENVPHPFESGLVHHWQSPDIKVDASDPTYQTVSPVADFATFQSTLVHETARRTVPNRFYAQVHNRGPNLAHDVTVRAFFAHAAPGLPLLLADFWTMGRPFAGTIGGTDWTAVGDAITFPSIRAAEAAIASWEWIIPSNAPEHSCLLVVATSPDDPIVPGELDPDALVKNSKHVALLNLHVLDPGAMAISAIMLRMWGRGRERTWIDLVFDWGTLPEGTRVAIAFQKQDGPATNASERELAKHGVEVGKLRKEPFPRAYGVDCDEPVPLDTSRVYRPKRGKHSQTVIPRVAVPAHAPLTFGVHVALPKRHQSAKFDLMQRKGATNVGGCSFVVRPKRT
jgi:hypothetical protein